MMIEEARAEHPEVSIKDLCELMGVSRSWYYERPTPQERTQRDVQLRDAIERIVLEFPGYGYRRVTAALRREGWSVNRKRVLRIMREESLLCRRFKVTTESAHPFKRYPNLIKETLVGHPMCAPPSRKGSGPGGGGLLQTGSMRREPDNRRENAKTASPTRKRATIRRRLPAVRGGQQAATGRCASGAAAER